MHVLGSHGRIACQLKLTVRLLLQHPQGSSKHRSLHVNAAEQLQQQGTAGRHRQCWLRNTVLAIAGGAGLSLAVASGGERSISRAIAVYVACLMYLSLPPVHLCGAVSAGDSAHARAIVAAVPRTSNAIFWVAQSSLEYRRCVAAHPSKDGDEYTAALDEIHQRCADRLLKLCQVCLTVCLLLCPSSPEVQSILRSFAPGRASLHSQTNGSLYIKAAQFATTIPSVPAPYRR